MVEPYEPAIQLLETVPGILRQSSPVQIISEIGVDMSQFTHSKRLCCWADLSPSSNEPVWQEEICSDFTRKYLLETDTGSMCTCGSKSNREKSVLSFEVSAYLQTTRKEARHYRNRKDDAYSYLPYAFNWRGSEFD